MALFKIAFPFLPERLEDAACYFETNDHAEYQTMPSLICCPDAHPASGILIRDAAIALSEGKSIGACKKCGKELQYRIDHTYANEANGKTYSYVVTKAVRLGTRLEGENYDPFLFVMFTAPSLPTGKSPTKQ